MYNSDKISKLRLRALATYNIRIVIIAMANGEIIELRIISCKITL